MRDLAASLGSGARLERSEAVLVLLLGCLPSRPVSVSHPVTTLPSGSTHQISPWRWVEGNR